MFRTRRGTVDWRQHRGKMFNIESGIYPPTTVPLWLLWDPASCAQDPEESCPPVHLVTGRHTSLWAVEPVEQRTWPIPSCHICKNIWRVLTWADTHRKQRNCRNSGTLKAVWFSTLRPPQLQWPRCKQRAVRGTWPSQWCRIQLQSLQSPSGTSVAGRRTRGG